MDLMGIWFYLSCNNFILSCVSPGSYADVGDYNQLCCFIKILPWDALRDRFEGRAVTPDRCLIEKSRMSREGVRGMDGSSLAAE